MSGLFGAIIHNEPALVAALNARLDAAQAMQAHRGPDMAGISAHVMGNRLVVLGHQRLSILDPSERGRQPMRSHDGKRYLAYNGEVYNYREIAAAQGYLQLKSGTDTEVVLERLARAGDPVAALADFNGDWALAMLDTAQGTLLLSRDRAGAKPLYYCIAQGNFYFASEIKTLLVLCGRTFALNPRAVARFIEQGLQDDTDETFFAGICSLTPGSFSVLNARMAITDISPRSYWDPFNAAGRWQYDKPRQMFRELFEDAVRLRMRADMPVGVLLTGGLDAELIAYAMRQQSGQTDFPVFAAVSPKDVAGASSADVLATACRLRVNKVDTGFKPQEAFALLGPASWANESPLADFSSVTFYLLMREAERQGIRVLLSAQGANTLLCGDPALPGMYLRHMLRNHQYVSGLTLMLQFALGGRMVMPFSTVKGPRVRDRKQSLLTEAVYTAYQAAPVSAIGESLARRQWTEYRQYVLPFAAHVEDRLSMAFAREVRAPYLDFRLAEFLLNAPDHLKIRHGWQQWILRSAYRNALPRGLIWRKEAVKVDRQAEWLRGALRNPVRERFGRNALLYRYGLVDEKKLTARHAAYCAGDVRVSPGEIFRPLALDMWLEQFTPYLSAA